MTGVENYRRTIEFTEPEHLPVALGYSAAWMRDRDPAKHRYIDQLRAALPQDMLYLLDRAAPRMAPTSRDGTTRWQDAWGTGWIDQGCDARSETHPLEGGWEALDRYEFPDPMEPDILSHAKAAIADRKGRYVRAGVIYTLFDRLWLLRGFENMLIDPYLDRARFEGLRDRILEHALVMVDRWLELGVDGFLFTDDWGSQRGLLMNPDDWRTLYKPSYKTLFDHVRSGGAHVWFHSCGDITQIVPDLVEIGLHVLNPVQPRCLDVEWLAREYGGELCFWGGVDVQGTMVRGTPQDVRDELHRLVDLFGSRGGGYIAGTSHSIMPETSLDNVIALCEACLDYVRRPTAQRS